MAATIIGHKGNVFVKEETYDVAQNTQYEEGKWHMNYQDIQSNLDISNSDVSNFAKL